MSRIEEKSREKILKRAKEILYSNSYSYDFRYPNQAVLKKGDCIVILKQSDFEDLLRNKIK